MDAQPSAERPGSKVLIPARAIHFGPARFEPIRMPLTSQERERRSTILQIFSEANALKRTFRPI